jgi:hypothetical protein
MTRYSIRTLFATALFALVLLAPSAIAAQQVDGIMTPAEAVDTEIGCLNAESAESAESVEDLDALFGAQKRACDPVCQAGCEQSYQECLTNNPKCTDPSSWYCGCNLSRMICLNLCCN